jgi:hypothetical protein
MSSHHKKKKDFHPAKQIAKPKPQRRMALAIGIGVLALAALVYFFVGQNPFQSKMEASNYIPPQHTAPQLTLQETYNIVVQRTNAIDALFQRVYTPGWEGAYGEIGEAHLYAATGDPNLLDASMSSRNLLVINNGTWVDDRAWACLAELYWWQFTGKKHQEWVQDAQRRYDEARAEGRFSHYQGFWSWYNYPPGINAKVAIITNTNMNQMANVACRLYEATHERRYYNDALLVWDGDDKYPGVEKTLYKGNGIWIGKGGLAAFGDQLPWEGAGYCSIGAAIYQMTHKEKYKDIVVATAKRLMDPANGWVDAEDFYQLHRDGNGAFVNFILDAYQIAPDELSDIPGKVEKMLNHVWTNHNGTAVVTLHRLSDNGIRNGWNPNGGEDGYNVNEVGTVHAQAEAVRAFGIFSYVLHEEMEKQKQKQK